MMVNDALREKRDIRDCEPNIIRIEFKKVYLDEFRKQSKQLELWKVITLASHYMKLMDSTRPRRVRQAVVYMRELDAAAHRIDSTIETLDQITNEVDNEIDCCAANFKKSWVTKANTLESCSLYQLSVQLQKQQKSIDDVADDFSRRIRLINSMHDNFKEHKSLLKKVVMDILLCCIFRMGTVRDATKPESESLKLIFRCRVFDVDMSAFTKLVHLQCGQMIAPVKERCPVEDLKTLSLVVDELKKVIVNLNGLRIVRKLIALTTLPEENDIAKLIRQAQKLHQILAVDETKTKSPMSVAS